MSRYNTKAAAPGGRGPIVVQQTATTVTGQGGPGFKRDDKSNLFLFAVSNLTAQTTHYYTAEQRDAQFRELVGKVALADPEWLYGFAKWLRSDAFIRTASLTLACDAVHTRLINKAPDVVVGVEEGDTDNRGFNRKIIDVVCQRADEPGELLSYWLNTYKDVLNADGEPYKRKIPLAIKRGAADAVQRLYNERSFLKWDSDARELRFGDVCEIAHPQPTASWQGSLYSHMITVRHKRDNIEIPSGLGVLKLNKTLRETAPEVIREMARVGTLSDFLNKAGMTWEDIPTLAGGAWTGELWDSIIPHMNVMALIRNLRNFSKYGVSRKSIAYVTAQLTDPEVIAKSKAFPMRFLAAYNATKGDLTFGYPLEQALNLSLSNTPALSGHTLILVDRSGSMFMQVSEKSKLLWSDSAAIFGAALAHRAENATLVEFGTSSRQIQFKKNDSVLKTIEKFGDMGGTNTAAAVQQWYATHKASRVIIITDEQSNRNYGYGYNSFYNSRQQLAAPLTPGDIVDANVPLHTINLVGYDISHTGGGKNRHFIGGLSDATFKLIPQLEKGIDGEWPWLQK